MKFEQALRAMRRGEKVRQRGWLPRLWVRYDEDAEQFCDQNGESFELEGLVAMADDWVILRKKKKAPALRDVFKNPRVGDVIGQPDRAKVGVVNYCGVGVVTGVSQDVVTFVSNAGVTQTQSRGRWAEANNYTIIHRAEG